MFGYVGIVPQFDTGMCRPIFFGWCATYFPNYVQLIEFFFCLKRWNKTNGVSTLIRSRMRVDYENDDYDGTFFDFLEMFIQYGQITLFMSVFPIGGVLAFINNIFEQSEIKTSAVYIKITLPN